MAQAITNIYRKGIVESVKFVGRYMVIAFLLWFFVMILASTLQIVVGIDFITLDYTTTYTWWELTHWECTVRVPDWSPIGAGSCLVALPRGIWHTVTTGHTIDIDVATFIVVGAIDLILTVIHTFLLVIGMVLVWLLNAFVFGEDSQGRLLNPFSLFQILKLIPVIQDVVAGIHGIDEQVIVDLDNLLTAFDDLIYSIANGFFTGIAKGYYNIAEGILGVPR